MDAFLFVHIDDFERGQKLADGFASVNWPRLLGRYAHKVNPLLGDLLAEMEYYWVTTQAEYSTDVLFGSHQALAELMPRLFTYSTLYFEARDVLSFLGRKVHGNFQGEVVTDQVAVAQMPKRLPGRRVKHRMKRHWLKLYHKEGVVLRVETVINDPTEFRIRRRVRRHGRTVMAWVPLRKGVAFLSRYQRICGQCNARYLEALVQVDDPTPALRALDARSTRAPTPNGRSERALNPVARDDRTLFEVLMSASISCVASPTAKSAKSSPALRSLLRPIRPSNPASSPGSCSGCTPIS